MNLFVYFCLWLRRICFQVVKFGPIPTHVVFLITEVPSYYGFAGDFDENTYKQNLSKIMDCVEWCSTLGSVEVSFYTFSCLTYKSPDQELRKCIHSLDYVLNLWIKKSSSLRANGIRIHVSDEYEVLPEETKNIADQLQNLTRMSRELVVNLVIGFPREKDITRKMEHFQTATKNKSISRRQRSIKKLYKSCFHYKIRNPQLIISNCGYKRLIDYLIWKIPRRYTHHIHIMWNEFSWFHFLVCVFHFQRHQRRLSKKR